jgi:triacylglycerol lipase
MNGCQKKIIVLWCTALLVAGLHADASAGTEKVDFKELVRLYRLYESVRFNAIPVIRDTWKERYEDMEVVDIAATKNRYFLGTNHERRVHDIVIRGTVNVRNALYDIQMRRVYVKRPGIWLHSGFEKTARAVYTDVVPRLNPDYEVNLFGHSLGGAEAVILAMFLAEDGFRVGHVISSGQPMVTDANGAGMMEEMGLLRVVSENDVVPLLPPSDFYRRNPYRHFGREILLLDCVYYCVPAENSSGGRVLEYVRNNLRQRELLESLLEHGIRSYLHRVEPKETRAVEVPFGEREGYLNIECPKGD